ncbi:MAG TPA: vitamin K epoxide reductase family protein [Gaiellaceae bacterium]|nr:vitamin K epoxide reductase family protein [Gaiellaceae bacterium]
MSDRRLRVAVGAIAAVGAGIAAYLTYTHFAHEAIVCATGGCETVQSSKYAELAGIPVALLGLAAYVFVLGTAFFRGELARAAGAVTAVAGVLFGVYLLVVQLAVIGALCQWCLASDLVLDALAVACILRLNPDWVCGLPGRPAFGRRSTFGEKTEGDHPWPPIPRT